MTIENSTPSATWMMSPSSPSASDSSRRPAPRARAIADEMPPPMAPAEIICISITAGNTSAMPASASVPSRATKKVSISPVAACAIITSMLGQARPTRVGTMAPCSIRWVRGLSAAGRGGSGRSTREGS